MKTGLLIYVIQFLIIDPRSTAAQPTTAGSNGDNYKGIQVQVVPRHPKIIGDSLEHITLSLDHEKNQMPDKLVCEIQGTPTPHAIWIKDGKELTTMFESSYNREAGELVLKFNKNTPADQLDGNFTCVAANFLGQSSKSFIVANVF